MYLIFVVLVILSYDGYTSVCLSNAIHLMPARWWARPSSSWRRPAHAATSAQASHAIFVTFICKFCRYSVSGRPQHNFTCSLACKECSRW